MNEDLWTMKFGIENGWGFLYLFFNIWGETFRLALCYLFTNNWESNQSSQGRWEEGLFLNIWCKKNRQWGTFWPQTDGSRWPRAVNIRLTLHSKEMRGPRSCAQPPLKFGRWPIVPPGLIHPRPCWTRGLSHGTHIILCWDTLCFSYSQEVSTV